MKNSKSILISILGFLLSGIGFYFIRSLTDPEGIMKTFPYILVGIGCGMFGHGIGDLINIEIDQKDERNIMISNMAKAKGYDVMTYVFAALLLAYGLMGASMEIIIPFVIAYLFVQFYAVYIRMRKDKEN